MARVIRGYETRVHMEARQAAGVRLHGVGTAMIRTFDHDERCGEMSL